MYGNNDYTQVHNMLKRWLKKDPDFTTNKIPSLLYQSNFSYTTYNIRLSHLYEFFEWYKPDSNPLKGVNKMRKPTGLKNIKREPLSRNEIKKILTAIKTDEFTNSRYKHSHYYPFLYCMFATGIRNEEAVGLRVKNVMGSFIRINEVMARGMFANAGDRIRKDTKNGKHRDLPISGELKKILLRQCKDKSPDDLVFTSQTGMTIDDKMFQVRVFRPVLEKLKIPIRDLYCARHSFASHAIEQGIPPATVALLMGSTVRTIITRYVHATGVPDKLPNIL